MNLRRGTFSLRMEKEDARKQLREVLHEKRKQVVRMYRKGMITSELPVEHWHAYLNDPTLADAILDRVLHAAHKMSLTGESLRKTGKEKL